MKRVLNKKEVKEVLRRLIELYPDAGPELHFKSDFELLIATILSARTTDKQVNKVGDEMFLKYNTPKDFATMDLEKLEDMIKSIGFYKNKAKNIKAASLKIIDTYGGEVPHTFDELITLPGVGRKTANVVLSNAFNIPRIAVDTHVFRLSNRIGIVREKNELDTEEALMRKIDKDMWSLGHHLLIFHGRRVCKAMNPKCKECALNDLCIYYINGGI